MTELDEIRLLNKKHHQQERQRKEEEEKRKKADEATTVLEDDAATTANVPVASQEVNEDEVVLNFTADVHNIMNGFEEMETEEHEEEDEDERSLMKKRPGSSKASSRRSRTAVRQVSPPDSGAALVLKPVLRTPSIAESVNHKYKRTIFKLAILLTSEKKFEEFTQALMAFLTNAQMVDPKFVINPLNPKSVSKDISTKGDISPNMTKLGEHIKISGNGPNVFNKRKVWDKDDGRKSWKANKKEEFQNPTVYFSMFVSSETPPKDIIERTTHEWARMNGVRLQIKELQFVDTETVVSIYKVSKLTPKDVILEELKKILLMAQEKARKDDLELELYDFLLDLDVEDTSVLPAMTLRIQAAKLRGEEVATFNRLINRAQYARKTWHLEVPSAHAAKMKSLVEIAKAYKCVDANWGVHAHLSKVTDIKSTVSEAKRQVEIAQKHTNYEVSMTTEELIGVIDLDYAAKVCHPTSGKEVGSFSLRYALMNFVKMSDGRPAIAEAHQSSISKPTHLVVPNTPEAERIINMMNKNLPAYLYHTLIEHGLPEEFVEELLEQS